MPPTAAAIGGQVCVRQQALEAFIAVDVGGGSGGSAHNTGHTERPNDRCYQTQDSKKCGVLRRLLPPAALPVSAAHLISNTRC